MRVRGEHHSLPKLGEYANGDRAFLLVDDLGRALFGVIDGLGHGPDAEAASVAAITCLEKVSLDLSLGNIMEQVHARLAGTRGVAATICVLREQLLEVCAVGNVELRSPNLKVPLVYSAGVLGGTVRKFKVCSAVVQGPTRLVAFSDGISSRARVEDVSRLTPADACHFIMGRYRRETDDATVLVADVE